MLKINSKKKGSKSTKTPKPQVAVKKEAPKPEWNSTQSDMDRYKLSRAELVQRKVALMSKHQFEAKELWLKRQEKLKKGIVDEETQSVMDTCLSTKRQPEKNRKNLTYFIKDDNYDTREYSEDVPHEDESEQQLSLLDLQHEIEFKEKPRPQPKKAQEAQRPSHKTENEEAGAGGDFIKKVNQSLKDARDLIGKIERYPSITKSNDPEKALSALHQQNSHSQKENKPRTSSIPKQRAKATPATKEPLRQSQNSQLGASTNSDRRVDIFDSKSDLAQRRVAEESQKTVKFDEPENEEHEDISQYFKSLKSLNQIEDTIKFLEDNIIGHKDTKTEEIAKNKFEEEREFETNKTNKHKRESFSPVRKPASPKKKVEYSPQLVSEDRDYMKSRDNFGFSDIKPNKPEKDHDEHDQSHEKELTHEDEQISFDLTMRSEHPEMKPNVSYDADDFGGDHHNDISATLKRPYPTPYQESPSVSFPQVIFENKTLKDKSHYEPATYKGAPTQSYAQKNFQSQPPAPAAEEEEDDDLNIERIKGLLQATKNEIEKMNTYPYQVDAYNSSYKATYEDIEKENKSKNIESQFQGSFGAKSSGFVPEKIYKSEVPTQPKKSFEPVWEPQRRVLGDISNTHDGFDDDIPAPEPLNVKKYQASYQPASYQPSNNDDSLSIRSFRRK